MWITEKKQHDANGRNAAEPETFDSYVERCRKKVKQNRDTAALRANLAEVETRIAALKTRYQMRQLWILDKQARELKEQIKKKESGEEERELEQLLAPYIEQHLDANGTKSETASSTTGSRSRKRTASGALKKTAAANAALKAQPLRMSRQLTESAERRTYNQDAIRNELMNELEQVAPPVYVVQGDMCEKCNVPMIVLASEALLGCPQCSRTRLYIQATSSRIAYGEEVEFANFSYKRQNHFQEWLNTFQAKESTEVPQPIVDAVMEELYKKRFRDPKKITQKKVRETMKELKLRKYYDHAPQITARITGILPPRMTPFQAEQVKLMFSAIQGPFNIHCPPERTNFLSYGYCLYKFCELLGYDEFLPCFPLLKGKDKLTAMDRIWKKICEELDWQFIPSTTHLHDGITDYLVARGMQRLLPA